METKSLRFSERPKVRRKPHSWNSRTVLRRITVLLALLVLPGVALAAGITVKGKISGAKAKLLNPVWNEAKDPNAHRYSFREPSPTVRPDVRNLTGFLPKELCIVALGEKGVPAKVPVRVVIAGGRTTPVTLVVPEGQQIQFDNLDPFPHKLYDLEGKGFQAAETLPTKSRTWTPPGPGKYEIRDQIAPSIRSWVVVEPRAMAYATPTRTDEFAIELEPGVYKLRAYHNGEPVGAEIDVVVNPGPAEQLLVQPVMITEPQAPAPVADAGTGG
jgi:hypothetical protein